MLESISEAEKVGELKKVDLVQRGDRTLGIQRDSSFSGWCGEEGSFCSECQLSESDTRLVNFNFEVPLLQQSGLENGFVDKGSHHCKETMSSSTDNNKDNVSQPEVNNGSEKYVSFDLENGYSREVITSNVCIDGSDTVSDYEKLMAGSKDPLSAANILKTLILILTWYTFSTFLTLYNKTLLGDNLGKFPAPLLMNTVHFGMQAVSAKAITWYWSSWFQPSVKMSWRDYFLRVVPTALGTALDVNLSNESLVFISVTFATMCKSAAPIFLVLFAFAFRLESPSFKLMGIISIISAGVLLAVSRETEFKFWGFVFVMLAALTSGFRWCMTQLLLQKDDYGLKNPLTLMSYVAPVMTVLTAVLSLILDPWDQFLGNNYFNSPWHVTRSSLLMLFGGALAFFMVITEYILLSATSAVTVTIAGVVKEAVTIVVAVFYFHDEFTWLKGVGLITIMVGVGLFNWYKYQKLRKGHASGDQMSGPASTNAAPKYVILAETDDRDDET